MFYFSFFLGLYSIFLLLLGHLGLLTKFWVGGFTFVFLFLLVFLLKGKMKLNFPQKFFKRDIFWLTLVFLTLLLNFIGAISPEISYDALWYHLTIPKLFIEKAKVYFIPGGLLYYSPMPKLAEMFYLVSLMFKGEVLAKMVHFSFGIFAAIVAYRISNLFLSKSDSIIAAVIFYTMPVVSWLSTTAYIDLVRTYFEFLALFYLLLWLKNNNYLNIFKAAVLIGLAIGTKLLALGTIVIFLFLIFIASRKKERAINVVSFCFFASVTSLPWFMSSFYLIGNPVYPIGSAVLDEKNTILNLQLMKYFSDFFNLFTSCADPLTPFILIVFPLAIVSFSKLKKQEKYLFLVCILFYTVWFIIPRTGGGRFFLPYSASFIVLGVLVVRKYLSKKYNLVVNFVITYSVILAIIFRFFASFHFFPYILGWENKNEFLKRNLDFSTNVFYDTDKYFEKNLKKKEKVLIYCTHNLFYINFSFIHESWYKGEEVDYILTQNCLLPKKFEDAILIYENFLTGVKLYKL